MRLDQPIVARVSLRSTSRITEEDNVKCKISSEALILLHHFRSGKGIALVIGSSCWSILLLSSMLTDERDREFVHWTCHLAEHRIDRLYKIRACHIYMYLFEG